MSSAVTWTFATVTSPPPVLSVAEQSLSTSQYDGEGRFRRNRRGQVTHFVYYEFGKRMGVARRIDAVST